MWVFGQRTFLNGGGSRSRGLWAIRVKGWRFQIVESICFRGRRGQGGDQGFRQFFLIFDIYVLLLEYERKVKTGVFYSYIEIREELRGFQEGIVEIRLKKEVVVLNMLGEGSYKWWERFQRYVLFWQAGGI